MRANKIKFLMENGLPSNFLINLTDSQLNTLHNRYLSEQPQTKGTLKVPAGSQAEKDAQAERIPYMTYEEEMKETEEDPMDFEKGARSQDAKQVGPASDDGFGNYDDGTGEFTEGKKKSKYNAWAICTSQMGKEFKTTERSQWSAKQKNKYERCVKDVKQSLKEGKDPYVSLLESKVMNMVQSNILPGMTKNDLIKMVKENMQMVSFKKLDKPIGKMYSSKKSNTMETVMAEPATKPKTAPPKIKPGTRPKTTPNPYQPPKETPKEKPRAEDYKSMFIQALNQLLGK
jgi:hypothetical protein